MRINILVAALMTVSTNTGVEAHDRVLSDTVWNQVKADTSGIYGDRQDSLSATVFVGKQAANYLSKGKELRTEVISTAGLRKLACCSLAESFENSASVTVGYSDAITGARQIRLLGLSGIYTQMLDENRPTMRGIASPFGLSYVPGQWLESIQVAKGLSSVTNGVESITGQINTEYLKPTDEKPLYVNTSVMNDTKTDFNIASSLQMGEKWSTVLLGHVSGNFKTFDHNHDGFMDDPQMLQFNFANRWFYYGDKAQVRFGIRALHDNRQGGQTGYDRKAYRLDASSPWGSDISNSLFNAYVKVGVPLAEDNSRNFAIVADYTLADIDSWFGASSYKATQNSTFVNLLYQNDFSDAHKLTLALGGTADRYDETLVRTVREQSRRPGDTSNGFYNMGLSGEYTFHARDKFSSIAALRGEWYNGDGIMIVPRLTLKYAPVDFLVMRANGGRGLRRSLPLTDNIGVFSTGKSFIGTYDSHVLEDAWTFGGNLTFYLPFGVSKDNTYLSLDYFGTRFAKQMIVDYEHVPNAIDFYTVNGGHSYTNSYQADFNIEPFRRFTLTATFRYTDAMEDLVYRGMSEKPLVSRYKGVLNLQYATNLSKWIFDFTASLNGKARVYDFMKGVRDNDGNVLYKEGYSPAYPLLYLQVTRKFKGFEVYLGAENLGNFRQDKVILGADAGSHPGMVDPSSPSFDASGIWGPIMGTKVYLGVRYTLWKMK